MSTPYAVEGVVHCDGRTVSTLGGRLAMRCEGCGAESNDGTAWTSVCATCKNDSPNGSLVGLFVPHNCQDCETKAVAEERRKGHICSMCRSVYRNCCC